MAIKILAKNRKARFQYTILKTLEAGVKLQGTEVKSIRMGRVNMSESYCRIHSTSQVSWHNAHIAAYDFGNRNNHDPLRVRNLLLHSNEIRRLYGQVREQGITLIPLKLYLKKGLIKLELGIAKGKKIHDKRDSMKKREAEKEIARNFKAQQH